MSALLPDQKLILVDGIRLKVHKDYDPEKYKGCDGCGSGWSEPLVPDTIYFKSIRIACCPHDFRYGLGGTVDDKQIADGELLDNMNAIVLYYGGKHWYYPTYLALHRAMTYYYAVAESGEAMEAFMKNNGEVQNVRDCI